VFAGARFCDHCGAKIETPAPTESAARKCPRGCGDMQRVTLGDTMLDECPVCDGLWLDQATFEKLCADRERQAPVLAPHRPEGADTPKKVETIRYVPCPDCGKLMNRTNFAHSSGIIIDTCARHGMWFDADELRRVIEFIRAGGIEAARKHDIDALAEERRLQAARQMGAMPLPPDASDELLRRTKNVDLLSALVSTFVKIT